MPQPRRGQAERQLRGTIPLLAVAVAAYAVSFCCFAPRLVLWNGLYLPPAQSPPEVNRAVDALAQLQHPFAKVQNPNNVVLQWRLLFPLLGHALHLPDRAFLALPMLGCLLTLTYVGHVARRYAGSLLDLFCVVTLVATASWFFVSNDWLSYEDSWYVLGVLLVSFSRSRRVLAAACLTMPWIDERFVLTLPLALAVRWGTAPDDPAAGRRWGGDALLVTALLAPYVLLRLLLLSHDAGSRQFLTLRTSDLHATIPWTQYPLGLWMGLRLLWVGVIAAVVLTFRRRRIDGACLGAAVGLSAAIALIIAADLSRSVSMLMPAALLGVCQLAADFPTFRRYGFPALLLGNLLLPAAHVLTGFNEPIHSLPIVMDELAQPPPTVDPKVYLANAKLLIRTGNHAAALRVLDWTLRLDPNSVEAQSLRSRVEHLTAPTTSQGFSSPG